MGGNRMLKRWWAATVRIVSHSSHVVVWLVVEHGTAKDEDDVTVVARDSEREARTRHGARCGRGCHAQVQIGANSDCRGVIGVRPVSP